MAYNTPLIRSVIKEFHMKQKHFLLIGPSSINLVAKSLGIQLNPFPRPNSKLQFKDIKEHKIISIPYYPNKLDEDQTFPD